MQRKSAFRGVLFRFLSFESYLSILSRFYFLTFNLGLLKRNRLYDYPYFLKNIIRPGEVIVDIGANLGYLSVLFAKLTGEKGKVYAVEPVKPVLAVLRKNTRKYKNVEIVPYALGTENKPIQLGNNTKKDKGYVASGSHFVLDKNLTDETSAETEFDAQMKRGSELFGDLERLDFIKIDIEGYEAVVIPEMEPVIMKHKPMVLIEARRESRKQMIKFFTERDFEAYVLENDKLQPAKEDEYWDMLIVHKDHRERLAPYFA